MIQPKEDMKWLEKKFDVALLIFVYPLLWLFDQSQNDFNAKAKQAICLFILGLFFWIGVAFTGHSIVLYLVEKFVHL